jgi:5-methylcytosine-specific restriction endonuclease McrA
MNAELRSKLYARFDQPRHFHHTTWQEINDHFHFDEKEKLYCEYCGIELQATAPFPYSKVVSLNMKQPLALGGAKSFDNVAICCCRCNIVKGTMNEETFKAFHRLLNVEPEMKEKIFEQFFWGKRRQMLERKKEPAKYLWELV